MNFFCENSGANCFPNIRPCDVCYGLCTKECINYISFLLLQNIVGKDCKITEPMYKNTFDLSPLYTTLNYTKMLSNTDYVTFNVCGDIIHTCNNLTHAAACFSRNGTEHLMGKCTSVRDARIEKKYVSSFFFQYTNLKFGKKFEISENISS